MASVTRSNRRPEGLHHAHHHRPHPHPHTHHHLASPLTSRAGNPANGLFASSDGAGRGGRQKRTLEPADRDIDALRPKKTRIAVEILARHQPLPAQGVRTSTVVQPPFPPIPRPAPAPPPRAISTNAQKPISTLTTTTTTPVAPPIPTPVFALPALVPPEVNSDAALAPPVTATAPLVEQEPNVTRHQARFINGIRAELDRLQPQSVSAREPGRKLRSQEAIRFKSDLSAYFPDYDEVIGNDLKEQHLLNLETPIVVVDSNSRRVIADTQRGVARVPHPSHFFDFPVRGYGDSLYTDVFDSQRIDFKFLETQPTHKNVEDPLPDTLFESSHKRAERLERSIRNSEKGRAQHEKDQIIRLLEGLQGHDWLRVMGVSGVTETKKKSFEPARAHFIKGCQGILEKFRTWTLEEKRRKLEKEKELQAEQEAALAQQEEYEQEEKTLKAEEIEDSTAEDDDYENGDKRLDTQKGNDAEEVLEDAEEVVTSSQSDTSDASPAKQLRQEALARSQLAVANARKLKAPQRCTPPKSTETRKEFTSFFSKKYERDNALNRTRRIGRKVLAWGHPIPDLTEADFVLPKEYRDEELLKSRARKKRRDKRSNRP
ncbi:hypothetical protein NOR_05747 [Metarhizium rileyi]|uniref:Something about silencing protein 4 domain-containing protein n=1 Tax=Metarhizium rileyi (strain RCEF 4871) TaxID=1649241 RepID=A0A167C118_METRR|nr:hypothetical protein NOR_05747 [Metarhizium rileyi RCEF 4871]